MPREVLSPQVFHILVALAACDHHGYGIMQDIAARTDGSVRLSAGTLYGCIKRLLEQGWIIELPDANSEDERRRCYRLTPLGRKAAKAEAERMTQTLEQARAYGLAPKRS